MAGTRPTLFGIALILVSGFLLLDGAVGGVVPMLGLFVGLVIAFLGMLYGIPPASSE